jgi:8-oxo-dGTP pyrophosphatase MutT (NUDIX family)
MKTITAMHFADSLRPRLMAPEAAAAADRFRMGFGAQERFFEIAGEGAGYRPAAVLVPVIDRAGGATVLLTERCTHLPDHGGQISFPGGRMEEDDAGATAAALRETREEVGLPDDHDVQIVGALDQRGTISNYRVTPIIAVMAPFDPVPEVGEVADIFEVPLDFVLNPYNHEGLHSSPADNRPRQMYAIRYEGHFIFGFTARILVQLSEIWLDGDYTPDANIFGSEN